MTKLYPLRWLFTLLLFFSIVPLLMAATITVTNSDDSGPGSLRRAAANVTDGDTILFAASTNGVPIVLDEAFIAFEDDVTVIGNGMSETIIDGDGTSRIFSIRGNATVKIMGLTIRNGFTSLVGGGIRIRAGATLMLRNAIVRDCVSTGSNATQGGGGIANEGTLITNRVLITGNTATTGSGSGGGVLNSAGASLQMYFTSITDNEANRAGGGIEDASGGSEDETYLRNCMVNDNVVNTSPGNGGGIHVGGNGNLRVRLSEVNNNTAGSEGGGIWMGTGRLIIRGTLVDGNVASGDGADQGGGGLYNDGGLMMVDPDTRITNNQADGASGSGGGILIASTTIDGATIAGSLRINDATISNNTANRAGGGIEHASGAAGNFYSINARIDSNEVFTSPGNGGGIHITGDANPSILRGSISYNTAGAEGGGLWNGVGTMTIRGTLVDNNTAAGDLANQGGGGLYNNGGILRVNPDTRISNNRATGVLGSGGGILTTVDTVDGVPFTGKLQINDAVIVGNTANRAGGGIEDASSDESIFYAINATIDSNTVVGPPGNGGGIHFTGVAPGAIVRTQFVGNVASAEGGAIWNGAGNLFITGGLISGNAANGTEATQGGGGIYNDGGQLVVTRGTIISSNSANEGSGSGGGIFNADGGTLVLNAAIIDGNEASRAGGGIEDASGSLTIFTVTNSTITSNMASSSPGNGGGVHITGDGTLTLSGGEVSDNTAALEGGGIWNDAGTTEISGTLITANTAAGDAADDGGGGIFNNGGIVAINEGTVISDNQATGASGSGGGILSVDNANDPLLIASITVVSSSISGNSASRAGGGVEIADGNFTSVDAVLDGNTTGSAPGNGGALHVSGMESLININGGSVINNTATNEGGGLWNQAGTTMIVENVIVMGNTVANPEATEEQLLTGGGLYNNGGTLNITSSTISGNSVSLADGSPAAGAGGGVSNSGVAGTLSIFTSTIAGNSAPVGGAIANVATANLQNSTITDNSATTAGGGISQAVADFGGMMSVPSFVVEGTVVSANTAPADPDVSVDGGDFVSNGYNFFGTGVSSSVTLDGDDLSGDDPQLGELADNGGMTMTYEPDCGSPLIGAGNPNVNTPDQLGQAIIDVRDIGSFEKQSVCASVVGREQDMRANSAQSSEAESVEIYPNPTHSGYLNVQVPQHYTGQVTLRIMDASGRLRQSSVREGAGSYRISLNDYKGGSYILQVVTTEETETVRFVIGN